MSAVCMVGYQATLSPLNQSVGRHICRKESEDITKYYCPDHPRQIIHDTNPSGQLPGQHLSIPPKIVTRPLDHKEYYLEKCKSDDPLSP